MQHTNIVLPSNQKWLISRMQSLGYPTDSEGICFGLAHAGMQAEMAGELGNFYRRLQLIYGIPEEQFTDYIEKLIQWRVELIGNIKAQIEENPELFASQKALLGNELFVQKKLAVLKRFIEETISDANEREVVFEKSKKDMLENIFIQLIIDETLEQLSEDDQLKFEIPALFDTIELYHQASLYPHLFESENQYQFQQSKSVFSLMLSKKLEMQGSIVTIDRFSGIYSSDDLKDLFLSLKEALEYFGNELPINMILENSIHTISINYNPDRKGWIVIDAEFPELMNDLYTYTSEEIAECILKLMSDTSITTFSTTLYSTEVNEPTQKSLNEYWKNTNTFKSLHTVTVEKANLTDSDGASWPWIAAKNGECKLMRKLLRRVENINNVKINNKSTALHIAVEREHMDVIKTLIDMGASVNALREDGCTPLHLTGNIEIIRCLLANGAEVNIKDADGKTAIHFAGLTGNMAAFKLLLDAHSELTDLLHMAVELGNIELVKLLLKKNADVNERSTITSVTPLQLAAQEGHYEIAELLLNAKADVHAPLSDGTTALHIAIENGHIEIVKKLLKHQADVFSEFETASTTWENSAMLEFLEQTNQFDQEQVKIRPSELAFICGYPDIQKILQEAESQVNYQIIHQINQFLLTNTLDLTQEQITAIYHLKQAILDTSNENKEIIEIYKEWKRKPMNDARFLVATAIDTPIMTSQLFTKQKSNFNEIKKIMHSFRYQKPNDHIDFSQFSEQKKLSKK